MVSAINLSQQIRAERVFIKLTQSQLAAIAGVSTSFVRDAETRAGRCTLEKLLRLLAALNIELHLSQSCVFEV